MNKKAQPLESRGTQYRTVTRVVDGKRVKLQEPLKVGYTTALIDGKLQTVKV